jgi:hypothetical protein
LQCPEPKEKKKGTGVPKEIKSTSAAGEIELAR